MIRPETWMANVRGVVEFIADEQAQKIAWLGPSPSIVWYPDELYCKFFDDLLFDEFLDSPEVNLSDEQRAAGKALQAKLRTFWDSIPGHMEPEQILTDGRWADARRIAKVFLGMLSSREVA